MSRYIPLSPSHSSILRLSLAILGVYALFASSFAFSQTQKPRQTAPVNPKAAPPKTSAPQLSPKAASTPIAPDAAPAQAEASLSAEDQEKYRKALELFNKQDFSGSLDVLRDLAAGNPASRPPRIIVALWFSELQNPQAVRLSLEQATVESPEDPEAYFSLAEIALKDGSLTAAELLTLKGDEKLAKYTANPTRQKKLTRTSYTLKLSYANARQRWTDAQNAILGLVKLDGETAELDRLYARALFLQNQDEKARQALQRAEKLSNGEGLPTDAAMAQLYAARGDKESAKASLNAALKAHPKSTPVLLLSISDALSENNLDAAWSLVQRLYQEEKSPDVLKTYGKVALFRSDFKSAEAAFQEAVRQNPLDTEATGGLALSLCEQGDPEKNKRALQYAASNLQKQSNNRDYLATLGWTLYKSGQVDDAVKILQQSIADGQINAASAYYFAVILNERGQQDVAKQLLEAALSTEPPFAKRTEAQKLLDSINATPVAQPSK